MPRSSQPAHPIRTLTPRDGSWRLLSWDRFAAGQPDDCEPWSPRPAHTIGPSLHGMVKAKLPGFKIFWDSWCNDMRVSPKGFPPAWSIG